MIEKLTAYCACAACCGDGSEERGGLGLTAAGDYPRQGITIAAPRKVKLGTKVKVRWPDGTERVLTVQDRTHAKIDGWDLYLASHLEAVRFGVQYVDVTILGGGAGSGGSIPRAASTNAYSQRSPTALILPAKPQGYKANGARTQRRASIPKTHPGNAPASFGAKRK